MLANASGFVNGIRQSPTVKNGDKGLNNYPSKPLSNESAHIRVRNTFLEPVHIEEETLSVSDRAMTEPGRRRRPPSSYSQSDAGDQIRSEGPAYVAVGTDDKPRDVRWVSLGNVRNFNRQKIAIAEALAEQEQLDRLGDPEVAKEALRERFPMQNAESQVDGSTTSLKSLGTALHPSNCTECHFHAFKPGGCRAGKECQFCHELHPRRNPRKNRRFMRRILGREAGSGTTTTSYPHTDMNMEGVSSLSTPRSNGIVSKSEASGDTSYEASFEGANIPSSAPRNPEVISKPPGSLGVPLVVDQANFIEPNIRSSLQNITKETSKPPGLLAPQANLAELASKFDGRSSVQSNTMENSKPPVPQGLGTRPPFIQQTIPKEASHPGSVQQDVAKSAPPEAVTNTGLISLKYTTEEPLACPGSGNGNAATPVMNVVAGVKVDLPAIVDIAPEKQDALRGYLEFSVSPPLPEGLTLDSQTGLITGTPYKVQESPSVHHITITVDAFGRGGVRLMMLPLTSCQVAFRIVDLQNYTISWVRDAEESDEILLKLQKF